MTTVNPPFLPVPSFGWLRRLFKRPSKAVKQ